MMLGTSVNQVVWHEGMMLMPQHFQQQDRCVRWMLRKQLSIFNEYFYGFYTLKIDQEGLDSGMISLLECECVFPDGTLLSLPVVDAPPPPLTVTPNDGGAYVYLCVDPRARLGHFSKRVRDLSGCDDSGEDEALLLSEYRCFFKITDEPPPQVLALACARVLPNSGGVHVELDPAFIPTCINIKLFNVVNKNLDFITRVLRKKLKSLVSSHRHEALFQHLFQSISSLDHIRAKKKLHPETLFIEMKKILFGFYAYTEGDSECVPFLYDHNALSEVFEKLKVAIKNQLQLVDGDRSYRVDVIKKSGGVSIAQFSSECFGVHSVVVVGVRGQYDKNDAAKDQLVRQIRFSSVSNIATVVQHGLPGLKLTALSTLPPSIFYDDSFLYFKIEPEGLFWKEIGEEKKLAFHCRSSCGVEQISLWVIDRGKLGGE